MNILRPRLRAERGFTMLLALFVLLITTTLLSVGYIAVMGDTSLVHNDLNQKQAYSAAQAGIESYNYQLNQNPNYWETCAATTNATVPGSSGVSAETYTITPIVASTDVSGTTCDSTNPIGTMIEGSTSPAAGTFRIASTGSANGVSRTIVAQYKRQSFLNFVYYTDYETLDPAALYSPNGYNNGTANEPTDCEVHYVANPTSGNPGRGSDCGGPINFITGDTIQGPLHSEDTLSICGSPIFGRTSADSIQAPAYTNESGGSCTNSPTMTGTYTATAPSLLPPPSDAQLLAITQSAYQFVGVTTIVLSGANMIVTNAAINSSYGGTAHTEDVADPSNGVVYVSSSTTTACTEQYTPFNVTYSGNTSCGNAYVSTSGTGYTTALTIGTDNDIIINGNILTPVNSSGVPTGTALLGLIADNFVRVEHPVNNRSGTTGGACGSASNASGSLTNPTIYAAILAVNHSFIVDNYDCGSTLGTLKVYGAIAQLFRGPVGTSNSSTVAVSGYTKDYIYDDRLATAEPPYFLNPVSAAWYVQRQTECDNASACGT